MPLGLLQQQAAAGASPGCTLTAVRAASVVCPPLVASAGLSAVVEESFSLGTELGACLRQINQQSMFVSVDCVE